MVKLSEENKDKICNYLNYWADIGAITEEECAEVIDLLTNEKPWDNAALKKKYPDATIIPMGEFIDLMNRGFFTPYDGFGIVGNEYGESGEIMVKFDEKYLKHLQKEGYCYVFWYNK